MVNGNDLEVQEMPGRLLHVWISFRSRQGFPGRDNWFYVTIGVTSVVTWLSGLMQLLGRDIVFPCRNSVLLFYHDNVVTEVSLSQSRWSR